MHTTSQEYLIKLLIGDSAFSFVIETTVLHLNLSLNSLFCYTFTFVCKPRKSIKRVYYFQLVIPCASSCTSL